MYSVVPIDAFVKYACTMSERSIADAQSSEPGELPGMRRFSIRLRRRLVEIQPGLSSRLRCHSVQSIDLSLTVFCSLHTGGVLELTDANHLTQSSSTDQTAVKATRQPSEVWPYYLHDYFNRTATKYEAPVVCSY